MNTLKIGHWPPEALAVLEQKKRQSAAALEQIGVAQEEIQQIVYGLVPDYETSDDDR